MFQSVNQSSVWIFSN